MNLSLLKLLLVNIQIQVTVIEEVVQTQIQIRILLLGILKVNEDLHQTPTAAQGEEMKDQLVILNTVTSIKKIHQGLICRGKLSRVKTIHGSSSWVIRSWSKD